MTRYYSNYTDEDIINATKASFSIAQVLKRLGLSPTGGNYVSMHGHFKRLALDTGHFTGQGHLRGKKHNWTRERPFSEILVQNSDYHCTSDLKKRLIRAGLLVNYCSESGLLPVWRGQALVMILDHINGDRADNRIENLRLLCPNCNSQAPTFAGKNRGRYRLCWPYKQNARRAIRCVDDPAGVCQRTRSFGPSQLEPVPLPRAAFGWSGGAPMASALTLADGMRKHRKPEARSDRCLPSWSLRGRRRQEPDPTEAV